MSRPASTRMNTRCKWGASQVPFETRKFLAAIQRSAPHGVGIALVEWAGPNEHTYAVPWTVVNDLASADALAAKVDAASRPPTIGGTAIVDALIVGVSLLGESGLLAARRVIDVSGDGRANQGVSPGPVRTHA